VALAVLALAGCGDGGSASGKRVRGGGYSFVAPSGWDVRRTPRRIAARSGSQLLSVELFPLVRAYDPLLFPKVKLELDRLAVDIADHAGGRVTEKKTTEVAGRRVRTYEITLPQNDVTERITFVLKGKREYQLLCRFKRGEDDSPCEQLLATFALERAGLA
jgi:hypothetical protein